MLILSLVYWEHIFFLTAKECFRDASSKEKGIERLKKMVVGKWLDENECLARILIMSVFMFLEFKLLF